MILNNVERHPDQLIAAAKKKLPDGLPPGQCVSARALEPVGQSEWDRHTEKLGHRYLDLIRQAGDKPFDDCIDETELFLILHHKDAKAVARPADIAGSG